MAEVVMNGTAMEQVGDEFRKPPTILDKVDAITTRNVRISAIPERDFQRFANFAQEVANDNYAMAIKILLDHYLSNIKEVILFQELEELRGRIEKLELKGEPQQVVKKGTFGRGE